MDLSGHQEPVLMLEMSTLQWPYLHKDMSGQHEPLLLLDVSKLKEDELHQDMHI